LLMRIRNPMISVVCLVLGSTIAVVPKSTLGSEKDTRFLVADLLRQSSVASLEDIWSITIIDSADAQNIYVRILSKPIEHSHGVCESREQIYLFDDIKRAWIVDSSRQAFRLTDSTIGCDYSLDANSFARVSGGEIDPTTFLELQTIVDEEHNALSQLGTTETAWLESIPDIIYDVDSSTVTMRFLSSGCVLTLKFDIDNFGHPLLQHYSPSNVYCVRR
jgi:hypothetical protein